MKISILLTLVLALSFTSAILVNPDYVTTYPGEEAKISIEIENNENFDIEKIYLSLELEDTDFSSVSNAQKDYEDIEEDDSESETFTLKSATGIKPGDYSIPYIIKYVNSDNTSQTFEEKGSFGIRVSAKTDLDFSAETNENAVIGERGRITIEVINRGLGEIKSASVQIIPNGFELLSKDTNFIGTIDSDDSDTASFDVIYKISDPTFSARISYKDFDNNDQSETESFAVKVYSKERALELGLIEKKSYTGYIIIAVLIVFFLIYRRAKKRKKMNKV